MCSPVTLRPAEGSISVFHVPLNKNPAENETAGSLISDLFPKKQTSLLPSASLWHAWYYRKHHFSYSVLNQNLWKCTCAFLCFKSVSQLWLKRIICVSCRLAFQAWLLLLLIVCEHVVHLTLRSFCQQQLCVLRSTFELNNLTSSWNLQSTLMLVPPPLRELKVAPFTWISASGCQSMKLGQELEKYEQRLCHVWAVWQVFQHSQHSWISKVARIETRVSV